MLKKKIICINENDIIGIIKMIYVICLNFCRNYLRIFNKVCSFLVVYLYNK